MMMTSMFSMEDEYAIIPEKEINIPYNYTPYPFQAEAWEAKASGKTRFLFLWHRRSGKDKTMWNMFIDFIVDDWNTAGQYYYMLPSATQAKKVIWNGIDNDGFRFLHHIPDEIIIRKLDNEMFIELKNGSTIQLVGSDNYDRLVGSNPKGICFSEYSISNPLGWDYMRPVLNRNGGWAMFPYTARGKNHGYRLYEGALKYPNKWFVSKKDITETTDHKGYPLIKESDLDEERDLGMSEQMIRQEYYNDFDVATIGAYYTDQLNAAKKDGRLCRVPISPQYPVYTSWDLGRNDSTAVWFFQIVGTEIRVVDYYENRNEDVDFYINYLKGYEVENKIRYGVHILPHDGKHKTILSSLSVEQRFKKAGYTTAIAPVPSKVSRMEGINSVRAIFPSLIIDEHRCQTGLDCLSSYRSKYDPDKNKFIDEPEHDWTSHGADSLRYFAIWWYSKEGERIRNRGTNSNKNKPVQVKNGFGNM